MNFGQSVISGIGKAIRDLAPAYAACGGAIAVDGPLPIGDAIGLTGALLLTIGATGYGMYQALQARAISIPESDEKVRDILVPVQVKRQAYFTASPYNFNPMGLIMKEYAGSYNGRIIEWRDPVTQVKVFEWNEDLRHGSHYHAMLVEWDGVHDGIHYYPGTPVPEPWNSMYFGG